MNGTNRADEDNGLAAATSGGADAVTDSETNSSPPERDQRNRQGRPAPGLRGNRRGRPEPQGRILTQAISLRTFFTKDVWSRELATLPTFRRWGYGLARVFHLTCTNFVKDRCSWRAAALTYITVLSLVPMLALAFSMAKGLGAYQKLHEETIIPFLDSTFGPADPPPVVVLPEDEESAALEQSDSGSDAGDAEGPIEELGAAADADVEVEAEAEAEADDPPPAGSAEAEAIEEEFAAQGGSEVRRAIDTVLSFVEKTDVSRLGVLGLLIVIWTVIKLLGAIEKSFNDIWGVRKARSLPRKIADYFSTIILVPLLLVTGTGVMSLARSGRFSEMTGRVDHPIFALFSSLMVVWVGFAFAYMLMPNTRTRLVSALVGGIVGGTMWQLFQWAHLRLQIGVANYNAIYSTFAALPIFLFWVHSSWMTVLLGAEAAAAHQNQARHGQLVRSRDFDIALKETVALRLAVRITEAFFSGAAPLTTDNLADDIGCPDRTLEEVAGALEKSRILATVEMDADDPALVLAADPDRVRMQDLFDALKGQTLDRDDLEEMHVFEGDDEPLGRVFERYRSTRNESPDNLTLRQLVEQAAL